MTLPLPDPGLPAPDRRSREVHVIRVVVADDQELVREGFTRLLRDVADIEVVGEAERRLRRP